MREKGMKNLEAAYAIDSNNVELKVKLAESYLRGEDDQVTRAETMLKEAL